MKKALQSLLIVFMLVAGFHASAQTAAKATINSDFVISLDQSAPMSSDYTFDISKLSFKDKTSAENFFMRMHDNLVSYTVNYDAKTVTVHLMQEYVAKRGWTVADWNNYFAQTAPRYKTNYTKASTE